MIREGDRVRVHPREKSPPSQKYAGQTGIVTTTSPSVYGPLVFVQMDENPEDVDTGFREDDLEEVPELDQGSLSDHHRAATNTNVSPKED